MEPISGNVLLRSTASLLGPTVNLGGRSVTFLSNLLYKRIEFRASEGKREVMRLTGSVRGVPAVPDLSTEDWMLVLLGADDGTPIMGRTVFVKQLFVIGKELVPQIDSKFQFFPSLYGPYSDWFLPSISNLRRAELVVEQESPSIRADMKDVTRFDYSLVGDGPARARRLLMNLPNPLPGRITDYKRSLTRLGLWGLLHYVYTNYPEYTIASELRDLEELRRRTG